MFSAPCLRQAHAGTRAWRPAAQGLRMCAHGARRPFGGTPRAAQASEQSGGDGQTWESVQDYYGKVLSR